MSVWINNTGTWTDSANWSGGVPSGIGAIAEFSFSLDTGGFIIAGIPEFATITLGTLNVHLTGTTGFTIRGSLSDSGTGVGTLIFNGGAGNAVVNITNSAATGNFEIAATGGLAVQLATDTNFNVVNATGLATINAAISGSGELNKTGAGTLVLAQANSMTGAVVIFGGILQANSDAALGSGEIRIVNNATFRSDGAIDNVIRTANNSTGSAGSAQIVAATGDTLTLTGTLNHFSRAVVSFGSATDTGIVVASFGTLSQTGVDSSFKIAGGTLRFGDSFNAAFLLSFAVNALTEISSGAVLDTRGFAASIRNLDMDGGTIRSSLGVVNVTVTDTVGSSTQAGTLEGTAGVDSFTVNASGGFNLSGLTLLSWTAGTDILTLNGSGAGNVLIGSTGRETINGLAGNDDLRGNGGIDTINGDGGNDLIQLVGTSDGSFVHGGADSDTLRVGGAVSLGAISGFEALELVGGADLTLTGVQFANGFNVFSALSGTGSIIISLTTGNQLVNARAMTVAGGSNLDLTVNGSSGVDVVKGLLGGINDLRGNAGSDQLVGGSLADLINGGTEADKIRGDGGADTLTGGTGADVFKFRNASDSGTGANADIIADFLSGTDKLNFKRIDTNPGLAGDQAFAFVGTGAFAAFGIASIRYVDTGTDIRVEADVNGDGVADMHVLLQGAGAGAGTLTAADFIL